MFEHAAALQLAFIKERDERCKGLISSRAFLVVENTVIEQVRGIVVYSCTRLFLLSYFVFFSCHLIFERFDNDLSGTVTYTLHHV